MALEAPGNRAEPAGKVVSLALRAVAPSHVLVVMAVTEVLVVRAVAVRVDFQALSF